MRLDPRFITAMAIARVDPYDDGRCIDCRQLDHGGPLALVRADRRL